MYDFLLFVHVLSAFCLMATVVIYSAYALGFATTRPGLFVSDRLWDVGGAGTLIFGVWLVLNRPEYDILDGWIVAALVLWVVAAAAGAPAREGFAGEVRTSRALNLHWLRAVAAVAILVLMFFKPGI